MALSPQDAPEGKDDDAPVAAISSITPHHDSSGSAPPIGLVASTDSPQSTEHPAEAAGRPNHGSGHQSPFFYRAAQWTADGTTIVASTSDNKLSAFVLPEDLLSPQDQPCQLEPQSQLQLPEPFYALTPSPYFSLNETLSQTVLISSKDHPIQLHHLFPDDASGAGSQLCGYKLIRRETEEYITAESLLWPWPGTHFIVGSSNRLDYFDVSRTGSDGPVLTIPTIPSKRHLSKGGGVGMKGMVSALSIQNPSVAENPLVAAGTWTRWLGLYDLARSNKAVANWSVKGVVDTNFDVQDDGNGVVQTIWSPCGRYLAVNERKASSILVYDVRGTGQPVNVLLGRDATTQQRLSCDVFSGSPSSDGGFELWAGSRDGEVVVWEGVGSRLGTLEKSWSFDAHDSPVGATMLHPTGSVVATCSGAWSAASDEEVDREMGSRDGAGLPNLSSTRITKDCNIKVWAIGLDSSHEPAEDPREV